MRLFGIVGAGGHGREVMPIARAQVSDMAGGPRENRLVFVVEDDIAISGPAVNGHPIMHYSDFMSANAASRHFCIAIGDSSARERIATRMESDGCVPFSIFSNTSVILEDNDISDGAIFSHFTHVTSNVTIGKHFLCNMYAYVAHDCLIGDYVTLAPRASCNGRVIIEDHAYIGAGAVIRDGSDRPIVIGRGATIGMGAVVTKSVSAGVTVVGNPARPLDM